MGRAEARPSEPGSQRERSGDKYHYVLALTASVVDAGDEEKPLKEDYRWRDQIIRGRSAGKTWRRRRRKEEKRLRKLHAKENPGSEDAEVAEPDDASEETKDEG